MILTTMCYLRKNNQTLMLYRNKKENDLNKGKWIGVGGKFEEGESPEECIKHEVFEETNLKINQLQLKAYVTFPKLYYGKDEGMFIFICDDFEGTLKECDEGELQWIDNDKLLSLDLWPGDIYFLEILDKPGFYTFKMVYENDQLVDYVKVEYPK